MSYTVYHPQSAGAHSTTVVGTRNEDGLNEAPKFPPAQVLSWFMSPNGVAGTSPTCVGSKPRPLGVPSHPNLGTAAAMVSAQLLENSTLSPEEAGSMGFSEATAASPRAQKKAEISRGGGPPSLQQSLFFSAGCSCATLKASS